MIWKTKLYLLFAFLLFSCNRAKEKVTPKFSDTSISQNRTEMIEAEELIEIMHDENIKIIDFRKEKMYLKGHIPNSLNIWRTDIEDTTYSYYGMSADKTSVEKVLQGLGILEGDTVVIYDDMGLSNAARLWWVLKSYNFNKVKLLNGGWQAWNEIGGLTSTEIPTMVPSKFQFSEFRTRKMYIAMTDVLNGITKDNATVIIDTRTTAEYTGERLKKGAERSGRIPQSHHIDWMGAIDKTNAHKFKSIDELKYIYAPLIAVKDTPVITYCHTGVRSAHTTFVLTQLLGYTNVKNYDGSWSEWSYYENLPIEKDSISTVLN